VALAVAGSKASLGRVYAAAANSVYRYPGGSASVVNIAVTVVVAALLILVFFFVLRRQRRLVGQMMSSSTGKPATPQEPRAPNAQPPAGQP
jgi:hypothetical protein